MAKDSVKAYGEMTSSVNTYASNGVNEFIMRNTSVENMFHRLIIEEIVDITNKIVVYNLDKENCLLRFFYIDSNVLTEVVLNKESGTFNCLNIQSKPYLISIHGKDGDINQLTENADIFYSKDLVHKITIENPNKANIDFPNFISQLKL